MALKGFFLPYQNAYVKLVELPSMAVAWKEHSYCVLIFYGWKMGDYKSQK